MLTSDEINTLISQIYADQSYEFPDLIKMRQSSLLSNEEILKREIEHISCPQCGSTNYYHNGHTKTGKQDGIYAVQMTAYDKAGNASKVNKNTYVSFVQNRFPYLTELYFILLKSFIMIGLCLFTILL